MKKKFNFFLVDYYSLQNVIAECSQWLWKCASPFCLYHYWFWTTYFNIYIYISLIYIVSWLTKLLFVYFCRALNSWSWILTHWSLFLTSASSLTQKISLFGWIKAKFKGKNKSEPTEDNSNFSHTGLQHNINMPTTGEEAMKRLLACKGKDPYSILGVTPTCTDDDIKR